METSTQSLQVSSRADLRDKINSGEIQASKNQAKVLLSEKPLAFDEDEKDGFELAFKSFKNWLEEIAEDNEIPLDSFKTVEQESFEFWEGGKHLKKNESRIDRTLPTIPIFGEPRKHSSYIFNRSKLSPMPWEGNICIPLVVDTEFWGMPVKWHEGTPRGRVGITTQLRGIAAKEGVIFSHEGVSNLLPRFPMAQGFHPVSYLASLGYEVGIERTSKESLKGLPKAEFVLYAFFALAELLMVEDGEFREDILKLAREKSKKQPRIEMQRRLRAATPSRKTDDDYVDLPWKMTLEGIDYAVSMCWVDAGAIHGMASYKEFCQASGIELEAKDNFTSEEKSRMLEMAVTKPEEFDAYALGDLEVYEALEANANNFKKIYKALGIRSYYQAPKLTIGSTVRDLFMASLADHLAVDQEPRNMRSFVQKYLEPASAGHLRQNALSTSALAAKVEGGRCRNNRPTAVNVVAPMVDLDISGCYGEGQRNQLYFVGKPEVLEFPASSKRNEYWTLRQFLKEYEDDLVPGGWFARVSTSERLKHPQDFFASWFLPTGAGEDIMAKYVLKMASDTEEQETDFNEEDGSLKIFNHEIHNGTLTHDGLDWIMNVASKHQRAELLDKLLVKVAIIYPKSWEVKTFEELEESYQNHSDKNTRKRIGRGKKKLRAEDGECHAWLSANLGELLIDDLLSNRKLYAKKTPMNTLYKLCVNTLYGDMTSKFFASANVVVGNNITARARALAWYMEKGLHGFQTITDGCAFELNRVVYPAEGRDVNGSNVVNLDRLKDPTKANLRLAPIGGYDRIDLLWYENDNKIVGEDEDDYKPLLHLWKGTRLEIPDKPMKWINQAAMEHLASLFDVDVLKSPSTSLKPLKDEKTGMAIKVYEPRLGQFEFEAKAYYDSGVFHGSANYVLTNPNGSNLKMRAYETKKHHDSVGFEGELTDRYGAKNNPAKDFLSSLGTPEKISRQVPFVKEAILKVADYKNRQDTWDSLGLVPGDSFYKPGLLREFSLSQFTFRTLEQYISWNRSINRSKELYGQALEDFYTDEEGRLDYFTMVKEIDGLIAAGELNPMKALDSSRHYKRSEHPSYQSYLAIKDRLKTPQQGYED